MNMLYVPIEGPFIRVYREELLQYAEELTKHFKEMSTPGQSMEHRANTRPGSPKKQRANYNLGKAGEVVAAIVLERCFGWRNPIIDFELRAPHEKGWAPDITYPGKEYPNVHVKATGQELPDQKYWGELGYSWTIEKIDKELYLKESYLDGSHFVGVIGFPDYLEVRAILPYTLPIRRMLRDMVYESQRTT